MSSSARMRGSVPDAPAWTRHPAVQVAVIVVFIVAITFVLAPPRGTPRTLVTEADVNQVAATDITATHVFDFEHSDPAEIERIRAQARSTVMPVWDHDVLIGTAVEAAMRERFTELRAALHAAATDRINELPTETDVLDAMREELLAEWEGSGEAPEPEPPNFDEIDTREDWAGERRLEILDAEARIAISDAIGGLTPLLDEPMDPVVTRALAAAGWDIRTEEAIATLLQEVFERHIVESRRAIESIGSEGIQVRTLREDGTDTRLVRNTRDFLPVTEVDDRIFASSVRLRDIDDRDLLHAVSRVASALAVVNTRFNADETEARRRAEANAAEEDHRASQRLKYRPGERIVAAGQVITAEHIEILDVMRETAPPASSRARSLFGIGALVVLLVFPLALFAQANLRRFSFVTRDLVLMGSVLLVHLLMTRAGVVMGHALADDASNLPASALHVLVPFAAGAMLVRALTRAENALVYALAYGLLAGVAFEFDLTFGAYALVSGVVGATAVGSARSRSEILRAGAIVGAVMAALAVALAFARDDVTIEAVLMTAGLAAASGATSALVVYALLPVFEAAFRYTTAIRLMELANLNHPALRELILKAPGTYHHSMMVGQLVEAGCEAIGADALLGRAGAYFHDIGKMKNPKYFAENQSGKNPHDKLKPSMSALIIRSHVKDGVDMARDHKLPIEIIDFIREHHGTSLIYYFYRRACEELGDDVVREEEYRYPGPKPQSRETAICLLADGIEAASRSLPDPSPSHLKGLVKSMINKAFTDGQLDECELTLKDLNIIANAFYKRLLAFYHQRPEYPEARRTQRTAAVPPAEGTDPKVVPPPTADAGEPSEAKSSPPVDDEADERIATPPTTDAAPSASDDAEGRMGDEISGLYLGDDPSRPT